VRLGFGDSMMTSRPRVVRREIGKAFKDLVFEDTYPIRKVKKAALK
jgi:hypothetical protein